MTQALLELPPDKRARLVEALRTGVLGDEPSVTTLRSYLGLGDRAEAVSAGLAELASLGISGNTAAAWIRTAAEVSSHPTAPDLVWSGPEVKGLHARDTRRVFDELLGTARESLWVSTFAYFDGPRAFEVLATRMDAIPELETTLLLNIQRKRGDTTSAEELVLAFAERFWSHDWPGQARPRVFYDPRALDLDGPSGVLHAKALVADQESVLITSANFTEAALDRNIELGLLVRDRALAQSVVLHFRVLIEQGMLLALPG